MSLNVLNFRPTADFIEKRYSQIRIAFNRAIRRLIKRIEIHLRKLKKSTWLKFIVNLSKHEISKKNKPNEMKCRHQILAKKTTILSMKLIKFYK